MIDQAFEEWYDPAFKEEKIAISFIKYLKSKIEAYKKELEWEEERELNINEIKYLQGINEIKYLQGINEIKYLQGQIKMCEVLLGQSPSELSFANAPKEMLK